MKRKAYIITFDAPTLLIGRLDIVQLHNFLTSATGIISWWHYLKGTYIIIVEGNISATDVSTSVNPYMGQTPYLVMEVDMKNHNGILTAESWNWISKYQHET
jgi:hypothetical protein